MRRKRDQRGKTERRKREKREKKEKRTREERGKKERMKRKVGEKKRVNNLVGRAQLQAVFRARVGLEGGDQIQGVHDSEIVNPSEFGPPPTHHGHEKRYVIGTPLPFFQFRGGGGQKNG